MILKLLHLLCLFAAPPTLIGQQPDPATAARRLADIASIAVAEYGQGVVGGRVVRAEELDEARLFLQQARGSIKAFPEGVRTSLLPHLDSLLAAVERLEPREEVDRALAEFRRELEAVLGVTLDPMPQRPPSLARGAELYGQYCTQCHGETGAGGPMVASLDPPPADLTDRAALSAATVVEHFRKINVGVAGTAMPGYARALSTDDRWALALHTAVLRWPAALDPSAPEQLTARCSGCLLLVSDFAATAGLTDDSLAAVLATRLGLPQDSVPVALVAYGRAAGARELLGGDRGLRAARVVARARALADEAMGEARSGDRKTADARALDAYLAFEEIESEVRARDAAAAARVEAAFAEFRVALAATEPAEWERTRRMVDAELGGAVEKLRAAMSAPVLFGQSLLILVREGLEAILIIGALVAFLTRAGAAEHKREIAWGVLAALAASGLTAVGFATLFRNAAAHQEALEGITMLLAAVVLFSVSYWLVSKIEVRKWQAFVRSRMERALGSRSALALAAVAFLAVYREGFETVLFYAALFTSADGAPRGVTAIAGGMAAGAVVLALVYYLLQRFGVRLPMKPFFAATSALLYVMAFSFAGQGMAELQEAGLISMTPLRGLPSLPALGVFPTLQTMVTQLLLAAALVGALLWVFWVEPRAERGRVSA